MTAVAVPLPRWQHRPASYTELRRGDRIQVPRVYHGQVADWLWRHLFVDHVQWISEGALLLWLTEPAPCGDRCLLIVGDAIAAGVRVLTPKESPVSESLSGAEFAAIRHRGEAPSRQSAAQVRADYAALAGEVNRLRRERARVRLLLARVELGEVPLADALAELDLSREMGQVRENHELNAAFRAELARASSWDNLDY